MIFSNNVLEVPLKINLLPIEIPLSIFGLFPSPRDGEPGADLWRNALRDPLYSLSPNPDKFILVCLKFQHA